MTWKEWRAKRWPGCVFDDTIKTEEENVWHAAQEAMRERAVAWAVEWTAKQFTERECCPESWDAGFPHMKAQALIDASGSLEVE